MSGFVASGDDFPRRNSEAAEAWQRTDGVPETNDPKGAGGGNESVADGETNRPENGPEQDNCGLPEEPLTLPRLQGRRGPQPRPAGAALPRSAPENLTPTQRLLLLDTWQRSGLPASDFAAMVGISKHTLYAWKRRFDEEGPGGLVDRPYPCGCFLNRDRRLLSGFEK